MQVLMAREVVEVVGGLRSFVDRLDGPVECGDIGVVGVQ